VSNFKSVFMSVVIRNSMLATDLSHVRNFNHGGFQTVSSVTKDILYTTWIVTLGWKVTLIYKVIICLNNCPRNCGHKFDEEQQCQKTSTVHLATDSSGGSSRFFYFTTRGWVPRTVHENADPPPVVINI
jgi:hypothetical protein